MTIKEKLDYLIVECLDLHEFNFYNIIKIFKNINILKSI